jgi:hypothetical protein
MTTGHVVLPIPGGTAPDASGSGNNPATPEVMISSGTQTTNSAKVTTTWLLFDPATDEHWLWSFTLPSDYASGGTLRLTWSTKGTSTNAVFWKGAAFIGVVGTTDVDAGVFDTVVTGSGNGASTQGVTTQTTLALTMTNAAANRPIVVMIGRDADNASDTNASDACLIAATFEYTTT